MSHYYPRLCHLTLPPKYVHKRLLPHAKSSNEHASNCFLSLKMLLVLGTRFEVLVQHGLVCICYTEGSVTGTSSDHRPCTMRRTTE